MPKDLNTDGMRDNQCSGSGCKKEMSTGSSQGNVRYSQLISESAQMLLDLDNQEDDHVPGAFETMETEMEESGRNISKSDQCIIESELSLDDPNHFGPTISYSASDVGSSREGNDSVFEDSPPSLRPAGPQLQDSGASNTKYTRNSGITNKPGTGQNCMRERSSTWEGRKYIDKNPPPAPEGYPSVDHGKHIGRMDDDCRTSEEFSYQRRRDFSSGCNADRYFCSDYAKHSRGRYSKSTRNEAKTQDRRDWNDREHFRGKHSRGGTSAGRESFVLGKRFRCDDDPSMDLDRLWCMEVDDQYAIGRERGFSFISKDSDIVTVENLFGLPQTST